MGGQKVGTEDAKIVESLKQREGNASRVLFAAERAVNKSATSYLVTKKAVNATEEELAALLGVDGTGGTGFSGSTGISGATGADEVRGPTGVRESGATSSAGVQESATGSMSGTTAASGGTGATGNDIPDNIAPTGAIEATAGAHSATGFSKEHSPLSLTEQHQRKVLMGGEGGGKK